MDKEEIKQKIKDLSYSIQVHREQGDFHYGVADKTLASVKRLEAQLAEAEKPELRHGDYGAATKNRKQLFWVYVKGDIYPFRTTWEDGAEYFDATELKGIARKGNIFDDLKALSEPLKEYRTPPKTRESLRAAQDEDGGIVITTFGESFQGSPAYLTVEKTRELVLKLRRLIFTAEQELAHE